jgi:beta-glucosidase
MKTVKFPASFKWGTATAAYQIEGAWNQEGRGPSIWDDFSHTPGKISDSSNGDTACDHYRLWKEDVGLMKKMNLDAYRFSLSWSRMMPEGRGRLNEKGISFYDRLIDELLAKKIDPFVTLYHWDLPSALQKGGGWENREIASWFADYTELAVKRFGDRVKNWITLNEPFIVYAAGYFAGEHAPGEKSFLKAVKVIHNLMLAHGASLERIRSIDSKLKAGIAHAIAPVYPASPKDKRAVKKAEGFTVRIFLDPVFRGCYPESVAGLIGLANRSIKSSDFDLISKPVDFIGVNNYTRNIVKNSLLPVPGFKTVPADYEGAQFTEMGWEVFPQGMYDTLMMLKNDYGNPPVYITENGAAFRDEVVKGRVHDTQRVEFLKNYMSMTAEAMKDGADVRGYFVWSLLDNFEWAHGYTKRFGLAYVDYKTQKRILKDSGLWYAALCKAGKFTL